MSEKPHLLIVEARFYEDLSDELARGATQALDAAGATYDRIAVPGALEIPAVIRCSIAASSSRSYDGYVALGCVIRGETTHYEIVSGESARGLMELSLQHPVAIGNGILTVEDYDQAWARAKVSDMDKGGGAARAALAVIAIKHKLGLRSP
jgi:6,7-dimethyl-8-ribityllumazine synthase